MSNPKTPRNPCSEANRPARLTPSLPPASTPIPCPAWRRSCARLNCKSAEHHDAWLRAKAEAENVRRRAQEDIDKARKFAVEKFAAELLAVKDSLEAALAGETQTSKASRVVSN